MEASIQHKHAWLVQFIEPDKRLRAAGSLFTKLIEPHHSRIRIECFTDFHCPI
jgi:hypothetical protein